MVFWQYPARLLSNVLCYYASVGDDILRSTRIYCFGNVFCHCGAGRRSDIYTVWYLFYSQSISQGSDSKTFSGDTPYAIRKYLMAMIVIRFLKRYHT